jgi:hypothetical protein
MSTQPPTTVIEPKECYDGEIPVMRSIDPLPCPEFKDIGPTYVFNNVNLQLSWPETN